MVLGAGAAGLSAARELSRHGVRAVVLEARDRLGGRIDSRELPSLPAPVEMGAEYVHGRPQITYDLLRDAGTTTLDVAEGHWEYEDGALREAGDGFAKAEELIGRTGSLSADISVEDFLAQCATEPQLEESVRWFRWLVEGFDAADPNRASLRAIAEEWSGPTMAGTQARPLGGYAPLVRALSRPIDPRCVAIRLRHVAEEIVWNRGAVTVSGSTPAGRFEMRAPRAIVTFSAGVAATFRFSPPLGERKRRALESIAMGPVVKVLMYFRTRWWETLSDERYANAAFLHRFDADFPTFWTQLPLRAPLLTAWAGGPYAARLTGRGEIAIVQRALASVRATFPEPVDPAAELQTALVADWEADPFARGAYSYVVVGGSGSREELALPLDGTLFFAGEATSPEESGTVSGALESGVRAAREALAQAK